MNSSNKLPMDDFIKTTGFDPIHGFIHPIPKDPVIGNSAVESIFETLTDYVKMEGIRESVDNMPQITVPIDIPSMRRLFVILTFVMHVYVRGPVGCNDVMSKIPPVLAHPLHDISDKLGVMPVGSYASTTQFNVYPFTKTTSDDDIEIMGSATGLDDELWFYKCGVFIERLCPDYVETLLRIQDGHIRCDKGAILDGLKNLHIIIEKLKRKLVRIREKCGVQQFYGVIRRYLAGWKNDPSFPDGMNYEGIGFRTYPGATAAQSPFIQLIDITFGIEHQGDFARLMYASVPLQDCRVLDYFKARPTIRRIVIDSADDEAKKIYNAIIDLLYAFRDEHLKIVAEYILKPANINQSASTGTGGSDPGSFLSSYKRDTLAAKIK